LRHIGPYTEFHLAQPGPAGILKVPEDYVGVGAVKKLFESFGGFPFGRSLVLSRQGMKDGAEKAVRAARSA